MMKNKILEEAILKCRELKANKFFTSDRRIMEDWQIYEEFLNKSLPMKSK